MAGKKTIGTLIYEIKGDDSNYTNVVKRADETTEKMTKTMDKNKDSLDNMIKSLAGAYLGWQGVTKAINATIGEAVRYESAFAGVKKTVDGTDEQLKTLSDRFIQMSKVMPVTAEEFAKIGEMGGQLGVPIENMEEFSRVIAMVGTTTNLSLEDASSGFARFANIMQMPLEDMDRLGSALVDLGNKGASTESEILNMALRIAGAGATLGLTEPQVLGWANALSSLGIEAEMGGSAISRTMMEISSTVSAGGKALDNFAKVAGMSAKEFKQKFKTDANGAMLDFVGGLQKIKEGGGDLVKTLDNLGFTEIRQRDTLLRLANSGDVLTKSISDGTTAFSNNNAMQIEADKRYKTTASQIQILKNNWVDLGRQLGVVILPIVNLVISFFIDMSKVVVLSVDAIKTAIFGLATGVLMGLKRTLGIVENFANGAIDIANKLAGAFGKDDVIKHISLGVDTLTKGVENMSAKTKESAMDTAKSFQMMGVSSDGAVDRAKRLSDAQTLLKKGVGESSSAIDDLVNSLDDNSKANKKASEEAEKLKENWKKLADETVDLKDKGTEAIRDLSNDNVEDLKKIEDKITDLKGKLKELKDEYDKDISSEDKSIAERIVEEKMAIEELKKKLSEARSQEKPDQTNISEIEAEIQKRQTALDATQPLQTTLAPQITEATRRAGLTDLQRDIEDYNARKIQIALDYEQKKAKLDAELALEEQNKLDTIALYQDKQDQINTIIELGNQRFKDLANNRVKITEDEVTKQIAWYNKLAQAIANSRSAKTTSELGTVKYSTGGYVQNGGEVHAGEYVIPAYMVGKYGGLVKALESIRTGTANTSNINNNITMNNNINEQIDMDAVLKNMSFELNK